MKPNAKLAFWTITLLLSSLVSPVAVSATDVPELANSPAAESACREEIYTGSRIKTLVCPGDVSYAQGARSGEQLQRPGDRQFTRSTRFPGMTVRSGSTTAVSLHD